MKKNRNIRIAVLGAAVSIMCLGSALVASAQTQGSSADPSQVDKNDTSVTAPVSTNFQIVSCNPTYNPATGGLDNDCDYKQLILTAYRFIKYILYVIIPVIGAMILFAGYKYMTANGDANVIGDAKKMMKPLLIGIFLIFGAWLIVHSFLDQFLADQIGVGGPKKTDLIGN